MQATLELVQVAIELGQLLEHLAQVRALELRVGSLHRDRDVLGRLAHQVLLHIPLVVYVLLGLAFLDFEQRRLRDVDVTAIDQLGHLPVEERKKKSSYVRAIDVRVAQQDYAVVAEL